MVTGFSHRSKLKRHITNTPTSPLLQRGSRTMLNRPYQVLKCSRREVLRAHCYVEAQTRSISALTG